MTNYTQLLHGTYSQAKIFTDLVDDQTLDQVQAMVDHPVTANAQVRIMPDCHIGKGSTIGTTIKLDGDRQKWRIAPNVVGVDIGCGMLSYQLANTDIDLQKLDQTIQKLVPAGFSVHPKTYRSSHMQPVRFRLEDLTIRLDNKAQDRIMQSVGTLGGGNHFIELSLDSQGNYWLTVHSGSRYLGVLVADHHQAQAYELQATDSPLAYLEGDLLKDYLKDAAIAQEYAANNRKAMLDRISEAMGLEIVDSFDSIHNFVDLDQGIIRKGATSAQAGQRLLIPLNMAEGSIIARGKGNADWNYSAPHGAGRRLSRSQARKRLSMDQFKASMKEVYSSSVSQKTLDEAPDAYKSAQTILDRIHDTVEIVDQLKAVYNFKAH